MHIHINTLTYVCMYIKTHKKLYLPHYVCVFYSVCFATSTKVSPVSCCCCSRWRWPMTATAINTMQLKRHRCRRRCCRSCVQNTHERIYRIKLYTHAHREIKWERGGESFSNLPDLLGHLLCRVALLHSFSTYCLRRCLRLCWWWCCCCVLFFKYVTCLALPVSFYCSEKCCQLFKVCCK